LAEYLGLPEIIRTRPPTTDTYSMEQSQEEFFFSVPFDKLDACLFAQDQGVAPEEVARALDWTPEQVRQVWHDIQSKRRAAAYLHAAPLLVEDGPEIPCAGATAGLPSSAEDTVGQANRGTPQAETCPGAVGNRPAVLSAGLPLVQDVPEAVR
jgi:hypothetical protein